MSDLNRPGDEPGDGLEEVETTEERLREQVGLEPADDDDGTAGETGPGIGRTPPPPD